MGFLFLSYRMEPNVALITCALVSIICAVYGIKKFNSEYSCLIVKWNKTMHKWCGWMLVIPSGLLACLVLLIAVYKGIIMSPM